MLLSTRALVERGHDVSVVGGEREQMTAVLSELGVSWSAAASFRDVVRELRRLGRADIVHAHMTAAECAAIVSRHVNGGALVMTRHFAQRRGRSLPGRLAAVLIDRVRHTDLAISQFVADTVGSTHVVYHGIDDRPAISGQSRRIAIIQRLEPEKDTAFALRAWERSGLGDEGWELVVAGDGSERAQLEALAKGGGSAPSVRFLGRVDDVDALRATAVLQLAPPRNEHFGLSVLEAMAVGLPVLAADSGAHRELIGSDHPELFFGPGDAGDAARRMRELVSNEHLRAQLGSELRHRQQERFSLAAHGRALEDAYRLAIAQQARHGGRRR